MLQFILISSWFITFRSKVFPGRKGSDIFWRSKNFCFFSNVYLFFLNNIEELLLFYLFISIFFMRLVQTFILYGNTQQKVLCVRICVLS